MQGTPMFSHLAAHHDTEAVLAVFDLYGLIIHVAQIQTA